MSNRKITDDAKFMMAVKEAINTPEKWCKHAFRDMGRMCIKGAIFSTKFDNNINYAYWKINTVAAERMPCEEICAIAAFNDAESTTHQDVMDLLDEAIRREISRE